MNIWTLLWVVWIAAGALLEVAALLNKTQGDTLSEHVWSLFQSSTGQFWTFMVTAFLLWLVWHFALKGKWFG